MSKIQISEGEGVKKFQSISCRYFLTWVLKYKAKVFLFFLYISIPKMARVISTSFLAETRDYLMRFLRQRYFWLLNYANKNPKLEITNRK